MEYPADFDWQLRNPRHRGIRLHPVVLIVLVNLGVVALGLTASCGLGSLSAEQPSDVTTTDPGATIAPPVQAIATATVGEMPPASAPDAKRVVQSLAPPARFASPPSIPKIAERNGYFLQLGAFADPAGALRVQTNLRKRGYPAILVSSSAGNKTLQLVRISGFNNRNDAVRTAETLRNRAGIISIVMSAHNP